MTFTIAFVSTNKNKYNEIKKMLSDCDIKLIHLDKDIPEYQGTPEYIIEHKCKFAKNYTNHAILVEDNSLYFNALINLPGPYIKYFVECGLHNTVKMLTSFNDDTAYALSLLGFYHDDDIIIFKGRTDGSIVIPRGKNGFGYDSIFKPDNNHNYLTYAEMDIDLKNKYSERQKSLLLLKDYLKTDRNHSI